MQIKTFQKKYKNYKLIQANQKKNLKKKRVLLISILLILNLLIAQKKKKHQYLKYQHYKANKKPGKLQIIKINKKLKIVLQNYNNLKQIIKIAIKKKMNKKTVLKF